MKWIVIALAAIALLFFLRKHVGNIDQQPEELIINDTKDAPSDTEEKKEETVHPPLAALITGAEARKTARPRPTEEDPQRKKDERDHTPPPPEAGR